MNDPTLFPALWSFVTVARTGSVGAAARQRHRTSSAISQQIRQLESRIGVKLLERAGRGIRLTPAGEAALPAIDRLWADTDALFANLTTLADHPVTTIRVAASDYLGKSLLVPVLRGLLDDRLPARFEIVTTHSRDAVVRVARGEVDFGVVSAAAVRRSSAGWRASPCCGWAPRVTAGACWRNVSIAGACARSRRSTSPASR